ncbi:MAG: PilZ domain-containing protein [Mariprofundales bacterium]|nr:PilZ domain-containing protein [Mariprofundales bacterium]
MGSSKSDRALEAMRNRARKIIGSRDEAAQERLLTSLIDGVDVDGCSSALADLLTAGAPTPRLIMTLLQCQPILFGLLADLNEPDSWRTLSSRFHRLQEVTITLHEKSMANEEGESCEQEREGSIEELEIPSTEPNPLPTTPSPSVINNPDNADYIEWLTSHPNLHIFNIFRGVVINASCQLLHLDSDKDQISIELNTELGRVLSADSNACSATLTANSDSSIGFPLQLIEHEPGRAIFTLSPPKELHINKRGNIDVHIQELVHVDIHRGLYHFPEGSLIDFSATGIGLVAPKDDRMKISLNDTLGFRFQIGAAKVSTDGRVCGIEDRGDHIIMGVELATNRACQSLLQKEVFRVQREIIVTLNEQGVPEDIAKDIRP